MPASGCDKPCSREPCSKSVREPIKATLADEVERSANAILTRAQQPGRHRPRRQRPAQNHSLEDHRLHENPPGRRAALRQPPHFLPCKGRKRKQHASWAQINRQTIGIPSSSASSPVSVVPRGLWLPCGARPVSENLVPARTGCRIP